MVALVSEHWQLHVSSFHTWSDRQLDASRRHPHPQATFVMINFFRTFLTLPRSLEYPPPRPPQWKDDSSDEEDTNICDDDEECGDFGSGVYFECKL